MFRNKEIKKFTIVYVIIAVVTIVMGFCINLTAGILMAVSAAAFGAAFFAFTRARFRNLANLSEQIDLVLHDENQLFIADLNEGELSILQGEIIKMTSRIREQNKDLKRERNHLADSLADIAHQLRTPLTSANLILSLLQKNPEEKERQKLLRENQELFAQMDWLVTSLLKLSRLDAGIVEFRQEEVLVKELVATAIRPLSIAMELHDIALSTEVPEGMTLQCDKGWMSEVILNLVKNCMDNTGDHGKIEVVCEDNPLFRAITVHDSGTGFKEEELSHVFDRFYRGKNSKASGYGIGLALSKSIVTRQGGTIIAKNHPEGGALFVLHFPK